MGKSLIPLLIGGMLLSGVANSIFSKYQDMQCVADCSTNHPRVFEQPVWQTATMFLGEMLCLIALRLLLSPLNPFRSRPTQPAEDVSKGKYQKLVQNPLDSGIDIDEAYLPPSTASLTAPSKLSGQALEARHGPTVDPVALAVDQVIPVYDEEERLKGWNQFLFALPAFFDICGTTLMNVGLLFTPVSIYQMTRSALVLFVGFFSVIYLNRRLTKPQFAALGLVTLGVFIVGMSGMFKPSAGAETEEVEASRVLLGICLILFAQVFTASQFVIEEKIMTRYSVEPLRAVGLEGTFGLATTLLIMGIAFIFIGSKSSGQGGYFDAPDGWHQIVSNPAVWQSSIAICISIALFNFFGLAVTKSVSATARSTIDCCRTLGIWAVSLYLGWQDFQLLQVVGFAVLVYGTFVFNDLMRFPAFCYGNSELPKGLSGSSQHNVEEDPNRKNVKKNKAAREDTPLLS